jgi:Ras-related protein Rab-1A
MSFTYESLTKKPHKHIFKIIIIGDSGVGKTSILSRYADDSFTESHISTIGVDFRFKTISIENKYTNELEQIKLQIWDTAGQERFKNITSAYYRNADGLVVVYDITDNKSFDNISIWLSEVRKYMENSKPIIIIGNKSDREDRQVTFEELEQFSKKNNFLYLETSARQDNNIELLFMKMAVACLYDKNNNSEDKIDNIETVDLISNRDSLFFRKLKVKKNLCC